MSDFNPNYYKDLELPSQGSSQQDIKNAYSRLAKLHHPDRNPGNEEFANDKMAQLNEAYSTLSDPGKRASYDMELVLHKQREEYIQKQRHQARANTQPDSGQRFRGYRFGNNSRKTSTPQSANSWVGPVLLFGATLWLLSNLSE